MSILRNGHVAVSISRVKTPRYCRVILVWEKLTHSPTYFKAGWDLFHSSHVNTTSVLSSFVGHGALFLSRCTCEHLKADILRLCYDA